MRAKLADAVSVGQHCGARSLAGTYSGLASRFLIKAHDWRRNHPLRTASNFATNSALTHSSDLRLCVNTWESVWLLHHRSFILKRQVCLFLGQALSCCTQPGRQLSSSPFSSSSLSSTMTSWNHPLMLPVRIWILLISPCTWGCLVMYISSSLFPAAAPTHADKQAHRHAQFICSFPLQRTNSGGCRQPVVFPRVSHSELWLGLALSSGSCTICMLALKPTHAPQRQQFVRLDRCRWEDGGVAPKTSLTKPWEKVKGSLYPTLIWCVRKHWHAPSEKKKTV